MENLGNFSKQTSLPAGHSAEGQFGLKPMQSASNPMLPTPLGRPAARPRWELSSMVLGWVWGKGGAAATFVAVPQARG